MGFFGFVAEFDVGEEGVDFGVEFVWVELRLRRRLGNVNGVYVVWGVYFRCGEDVEGLLV